jgi:hypothetical protein
LGRAVQHSDFRALDHLEHVVITEPGPMRNAGSVIRRREGRHSHNECAALLREIF